MASGDVSTGTGTPLAVVPTVPLSFGVPARAKKYRVPYHPLRAAGEGEERVEVWSARGEG